MTQKRELGQETEVKVVSKPEIRNSDHAWPFQTSAPHKHSDVTGYSTARTQKRALAHERETEVKRHEALPRRSAHLLTNGSISVGLDQPCCPCQVKKLSLLSTAMQKLGLAHDTASNEAPVAKAPELTTGADHLLPFHVTASPESSTTAHRVALAHERPVTRRPGSAATGLDQVRPFQVLALPPPLGPKVDPPISAQKRTVGHEM